MKSRPLLSLLLVLVFQFGSFAEAQISESDFIAKMQGHRWRVKALALAALDMYPQIFSALDENLVRTYLHFHDIPKTMSQQELEEIGYESRETLAYRLSRYYGINISDLSEENQQELQETIDSLNYVEARIKAQFLASNQISITTASQLGKLEHWADVTDTGISRRTEMNLNDEPFEGARFLRSHNQIQGAEVSESLERNYRSILCRAVFSN